MNELLWYLSRATGVVSLTLVTVVLVLGAWTSVSTNARRTAVLVGVHRALALGSLVFLAGHITTTVAETYVSIDLVSVVVPFTSGFEPLAVGLGTLAFDLLLAVTVTALLRDRLGRRAFRWIHRAVWAVWAVAVWHALALSSDGVLGLRGVTLACLAAGLVAFGTRLARPWIATDSVTGRDAVRRRLATTQEWT